jgi:hypothetical protein
VVPETQTHARESAPGKAQSENVFVNFSVPKSIRENSLSLKRANRGGKKVNKNERPLNAHVIILF